MRVFTTHLWKEWREHRAVLLGILVAMPVLTAATFVGFASFGAQLANGAAVFTGGAAAMTALALSVELFAGEVTRRTLGFWRRQPGGLAVGGLAKVAMLLLAVSVATVWGGLCFWAACRTFVGARAAETAWASLSTPEYALAIPFLSLALASWVLLTSTWVARGAAAMGIALLLLAAIAAPGAVLWGERTAYLMTLIPGVAVIALAGIAFPLAVAGLSLFVGRRRTDRPFRAALACFGVIVLGAGAAYAHANTKLERWLDVRPSDSDARTTQIFIGVGGRIAYVTVSRLNDDAISRPFAVSLDTGVATPLGATGSSAYPTIDELQMSYDSHGCHLIEVSAVSPNGGSTSKRRLLLNGATAEILADVSFLPTDDRELDVVRRFLAIDSPVHTLDGRRAWAMRRRIPLAASADPAAGWKTRSWIECETPDGGFERTLDKDFEDVQVSRSTPYGWAALTRDHVFIPADARSAADILPYKLEGSGIGTNRIDARRYLHLRRRAKRPEPDSWRLVDVVARTDEPAPGMRSDDVLIALEGTRAIVWTPATGVDEQPVRGALSVVDVATGSRGAPSERDDDVPAELHSFGRLGRMSSGLIVLLARSAGNPKGAGFVVFDPSANRLSRWTPKGDVSGVVFIGEDGTLLATRYRALPPTSTIELMRYRLGSAESERVFPR